MFRIDHALCDFRLAFVDDGNKVKVVDQLESGGVDIDGQARQVPRGYIPSSLNTPFEQHEGFN